MKKLQWCLALVVVAAVGLWVPTLAAPEGGATVWWWRQQLILATGWGAWLLMSFIMVLSVRPTWLERPMGGLDKMYRLHKWAGISAITLGASHYALELSGKILRQFFERPVRGPRAPWVFNAFRDVAKDLGEWAVWFLVAMLLITLWQRFPYRWWRPLHRLLALVYGVLAFHAVVLAPPAWWTQPVGVVLALVTAVGVWCALLSGLGRIGQRRRHAGQVVSVQHPGGGVLEITCRMPAHWTHQPGQFALVTFDGAEGHHPFTICSADRGEGTVRFAIKGLGDYTRQLAANVHPGQVLHIEGPYGRFQLQADAAQEQIWVAAGIGATPFLAWLESLQAHPQQAPQVQLHYCVPNAAQAVFLAQMQTLCAALPSVTLHVHYSDDQGLVSAARLLAGVGPRASVWFCGPQGFGKAVQAAMRPLGLSPRRFHQEWFQMR